MLKKFYLLSAFLVSFCLSAHANNSKKDQVCFKKNCFDIELAISEQERVKGLQNRDGMPETHGMLFVFSQEQKYSFWMKDTKFSLDIIWLDGKKKIVYLQENLPTCQQSDCPAYPPDEDAMYVLELNAGQAKKIGLKVGDVAKFDLKN